MARCWSSTAISSVHGNSSSRENFHNHKCNGQIWERRKKSCDSSTNDWHKHINMKTFVKWISCCFVIWWCASRTNMAKVIVSFFVCAMCIWSKCRALCCKYVCVIKRHDKIFKRQKNSMRTHTFTNYRMQHLGKATHPGRVQAGERIINCDLLMMRFFVLISFQFATAPHSRSSSRRWFFCRCFQ